MCVNGARWVQQQILDTYPAAPLKVYAVSFAMVAGDARERWRPDLLTDRRVQHWWDAERATGTRLFDALRPHTARRAAGSKELRGTVLWDAFLLFDRRARWDSSFPAPVTWGYTILAGRDALATQVAEQIARSR